MMRKKRDFLCSYWLMRNQFRWFCLRNPRFREGCQAFDLMPLQGVLSCFVVMFHMWFLMFRLDLEMSWFPSGTSWFWLVTLVCHRDNRFCDLTAAVVAFFWSFADHIWGLRIFADNSVWVGFCTRTRINFHVQAVRDEFVGVLAPDRMLLIT